MSQRQTDEIDARGLREMLEHALEAALGHTFEDREILRVALTHRSYSNERGLEGAGNNYERLEFLGDSVLGLITAQWLYEQYPDRPEGELARHKSYLVSAAALGDYASTLGAGPLLHLGVGEERSGGRWKASILADVVEALIGAVYLDGGLEAARRAVVPLLERGHRAEEQGAAVDTKTTLQERLQAAGRGLPEYRGVAESGPDHAKVFTVECWVADWRAGTAEGRSKKEAEQRAAAAALEALDLLRGGS